MWDLGSGIVELLLPIVAVNDNAVPEPQEDGKGLTWRRFIVRYRDSSTHNMRRTMKD